LSFPVWHGNDCRTNIRLQSNRKGRLKPGKPSFRRPFDFMALRISGERMIGAASSAWAMPAVPPA